MIDERDRVVLQDLARVAGREGVRFYVIGAGARFLVYDWPHGLVGGRGTTDWDIAVRVASWGEYEQIQRALVSSGAPFQVTAAEHRLAHSSGRHLDIVPFGGLEANARTVTYPRSETTHSVLGLRECEACCIDIEIGNGIRIRAVEPPGLVLPKAGTYLDRRPDTTHDLRDLDFIVRTYRDVLGDDLVFDRASDALQDEVVAYEDVGAYLLADDVRGLAFDDPVYQPLRTLVGELMLPGSRAVDDLLGRGATSALQNRDTIVLRYAAFHVGLET